MSMSSTCIRDWVYMSRAALWTHQVHISVTEWIGVLLCILLYESVDNLIYLVFRVLFYLNSNQYHKCLQPIHLYHLM